MPIFFPVILTIVSLLPPVALARNDSLAARPEVQSFIREMTAKHDFDPNRLNAVFENARAQPEIIELMTRPAESKPWHAYREIFLTPERTRGGVEFWNTHAQTLNRAEQRYGVPPEVIVAIIGVETLYGGNTGRHKVLEALATLAFDYPRRATFFRGELINYLLLTREEGMDPLVLRGSYAGAMGLPQFIPSSFRAYAVDFDEDGRRDLWANPEDAIGSVGNYLSKNGWGRDPSIAMAAWVEGERYRSLVSVKPVKPKYSIQQLRQRGVIPRGPASDEVRATLFAMEGKLGPEYWLGFHNFYVITRYNRSLLYALAVYQLSAAIRELRQG
jgi:membrane-bound lytic murein transglycosylase B